MLTGESDHVAKERGDERAVGRLLRRRRRPVPRVRGRRRGVRGQADAEARAAKRTAVDAAARDQRLLRLLLVAMVPLAIVLVVALRLHDTVFREAAQTATAGLIFIVPEGLVLLASVTFAAGAVRIARAGALAQQLNAIESLASVDTVCLDKTGTLTDGGSLELIEVVPAPGVPEAAARQILARVAAAGSVRSGTWDAIAAALGDGSDASGGAVKRRAVRVGCRWKWSGWRRRGVRARRAPGVRARASGRDARSGPAGDAAWSCSERPLSGSPRRDRRPPRRRPAARDGRARRAAAPGSRATVAFCAGGRRAEGDVRRPPGRPRPAADGGPRARAPSPVPTYGDPAALEEIAAAHAIFARGRQPREPGRRRLIEALRPAAAGTRGDGRRRRQRRARHEGRPALGRPRHRLADRARRVGHRPRRRRLRGHSRGHRRRACRILLNIRRVAKLFVVKSAFAADDFAAIPKGIVEGRRILLQHPPGGEAVRRQVGVRRDVILTVGLVRLGLPAAAASPVVAACFTVGDPAFVLALAPPRASAEQRLHKRPDALLGARRRRLGARGDRRVAFGAIRV